MAKTLIPPRPHVHCTLHNGTAAFIADISIRVKMMLHRNGMEWVQNSMTDEWALVSDIAAISIKILIKIQTNSDHKYIIH